MFRPLAFLTVLSVVTGGEVVLAQINPSGFLDPRGSAYMGTANPPNAPLAPTGSGFTLPPIGGSTLPPGAPSYYYTPQTYRNEIESNPALGQDVRRPFGGGGYRAGSRSPINNSGTPDAGESAPDAASKSLNFSERQMTMHADGFRDNAHGRATGTLGNDWRYVYFQRHHWYWMTNNSWAIWDRDRWVPHTQFLRDQEAALGPTAQVQVRSYRGYNSGMYGQMQVTRSQRPERLATDLNDRYSGPVGPARSLLGTSGGVTPVPGANAPIDLEPHANPAEAERRAIKDLNEPKVLSDSEVLQLPPDQDTLVDEVPDAGGVEVP